jgi:GT2 family glycosyltransferase
VSVVIPTRDRAAQLRRTVEAVLSDPASSQVVVVDDGSCDETPRVIAAAMAADRRVLGLRLEGKGAAAARQRGAEAASGEVLLLLDDDVVASPGLVTRHAQRHAAGDLRLVVVGYMPTRQPPPATPGAFATVLYRQEYESHVERYEREPRRILEALWSGNVSLRRLACLEIGIISPSYPDANHNDRDFGLRLAQHGMHAVFDRTLEASHEHERSLSAFLRDAYRQGVGRARLHDLYPERLGRLSVDDLSADLPAAARALVRASDRPSVHRALMVAGRTAIATSGAVRWRSGEVTVARLLRRAELRRGAREATTAR